MTLPQEDSKLQEFNYTAARETGLLAARTLITLNSGAFVVLLTYLGNAQAQTQFIVALWALREAMKLFLAGICFMIICLIISYFVSAKGTANPPQVNWWSTNIVSLNLLFATFSVCSFLGGTMAIVNNLEAVSP